MFFDPLPRGHFRAICVDWPSKFIGGTKGRPQHYARMTDAQLAAMPVMSLAHPDGAFVFVWTTSPRLGITFEILDVWGFRYSSTAFVWIKQNPSGVGLHTGQGFTTRKNAEFCLLFKKGAPKRIAKDVHEVIISPRREHSRKPDEFYERVERFCDGPYVELFGRQSRERWSVFGDEATKFDGAAA